MHIQKTIKKLTLQDYAIPLMNYGYIHKIKALNGMKL